MDPDKAYFPDVHKKLLNQPIPSLKRLCVTDSLPEDFLQFVEKLIEKKIRRDPNKAIYSKAPGQRIDSEVSREVAYQIGDYLLQKRRIIYHKVLQ